MDSLSSKNYYELLGIPTDASLSAIKDAYREIARVYHPDSNFYDEILSEEQSQLAVEAFQRITDAYHTLSDSSRRAKYDELLPKNLRDWNAEEFDLFRSTSEKLEIYSLRRQASGQSIFGRAADPSILDVRQGEAVREHNSSKTKSFLVTFFISLSLPIIGLAVYSILFQ